MAGRAIPWSARTPPPLPRPLPTPPTANLAGTRTVTPSPRATRSGTPVSTLTGSRTPSRQYSSTKTPPPSRSATKPQRTLSRTRSRARSLTATRTRKNRANLLRRAQGADPTASATATPTAYAAVCGAGALSDVVLAYSDYAFLLGFVAHRYGLEGDILPPGSPYAASAPCWAMPRDPAFDGPQWQPASLCGKLQVDVSLVAPGEQLFQFAALPGLGAAPLAYVATPAAAGHALLSVDRDTGAVRTRGNLTDYCGCSDDGWLHLRVELLDSRGVSAAQAGALALQLLGCEPQLECRPSPSGTRAATSTRTATRTVAGTASRSRTRSATRSRTRSPTRRA